MKWIELTLYTTDYGIELVCGALAAVGLEQVSIQDSEESIKKHLEHTSPYWDYADTAALAHQKGPSVKVYFPDIEEGQKKLIEAKQKIKSLIDEFWPDELPTLSMEEIVFDEEDWANSWRQYYKPMKIGSRLLVSPPWERQSIPGKDLMDKKLVLIEPGMVFGTGAHHTTRLCMLALQDMVNKGDRVLDIGCGSGILSVCALSLGAAYTLCVDIDPVAKKVVMGNMQINGHDKSRYDVLTGNMLENNNLKDKAGEKYDIIVANIVAGVVIALCPIAYEKLKPGGLFLCSGIIDEKEEQVLKALSQAGLSLVMRYSSYDDEENKEETEWLAFMAKKV